MWTGIGVAAVLLVAGIWTPFSRPSLEHSVVVVPPAAGIVPPAGRDDVLTILYSGDGGWADLDKQLGGAFAARGIPVLGVNTFKYFWRDRAPDVAAAQLEALITENLAKYHKQRVWLVGFSFGADVLPTLIDKLSPQTRARITQLVLLSPSRDVTFEIQFEGYMMAQGRFKALVKTITEKFNKVPSYPAVPPVVALGDQFPVVCYYGDAETGESLCTESGLPAWVTVHEKAGDHHFTGGYQPLADQMVDELPLTGAVHVAAPDATSAAAVPQPAPAHAASVALPASAASRIAPASTQPAAGKG